MTGNNAANSSQNSISKEIEKMNLNGLLLAQSMLRTQRTEAMFRLGINEKTATLIEEMSIDQLQNISKLPYLLFPIRFNHQIVWEILNTNPVEERSLMHAMISSGGRDDR